MSKPLVEVLDFLDKIHILYYRNVTRDIVMIKYGDYATLRQLEQEIRMIDPGNYIALHELGPIKESEIPELLKEMFE